MPAEAVFYAQAIARIHRILLVVVPAGAAAAWWLQGWPAGLGFLAGGAGSYLNFQWLHGLVEALGTDGRRPSKKLVFFLMTRYLLLGGAAYVIVKYFSINLVALLWGLCASVVAVMIEIVYELIYGT